jgi:hypothetical protein
VQRLAKSGVGDKVRGREFQILFRDMN